MICAGCGNPISNAVFYEDEAFLAALPSDSALESPRVLRLARVGDSAMLAHAVTAADRLDSLLLPIVASGEILRATPPDERGEIHRKWDPVQTAISSGDLQLDWTVRAEVLRPLGNSSVDWTIEASKDGSDWLTIGTGSHVDNAGSFTWHLGAHSTLLGVTDQVPDVIVVDTASEQGQRALHVEEEVPVGLGALGTAYEVMGEFGLIWFGDFALTEDGETWPGVGQAVHEDEQGGWAIGSLSTDTGDVGFVVCWNSQGDDVYRTEGLTPMGSEGDCPVAPVVGR